ncbi:hypothetical protein BCR37DRAFT_378465 [Protomyces lactucae-debilis]|uniref:Protein SQS1 n=1 Tax=Protomyces lactucae-debilis TaxID=2754530 RepID=A0A1Y2FKC8_PROLT|nr:uncharacterized protein BCR37DRAFT_378465 [Protomyces lactucae-debilis]ORY84441.1 hypothetical protein BCR37DRAFT_378465 [Protomyces lactucae-debilis]
MRVLAEPSLPDATMSLELKIPVDESKEQLADQLLATLHGDVPVAVDSQGQPEHLATPLLQNEPIVEKPAVEVNNELMNPAIEGVSLEEATEVETDESLVPDVTSLNNPNRTVDAATTSPPVDMDALLDSMAVDDELDDQASDVANQMDEEDEEITSDDFQTASSDEELDEEVSFFVDTEGDTTFASTEMPTTSTRPLNMTAASTPVGMEHSGISTPWARTIDDPVLVEVNETTTTARPYSGHAFAETQSRGKRGGQRKRERQQAAQEQLRMDEAYAIHLDYMENSRWREDEDAAEDDEDEAPLLAQMLAGLGPANAFGNTAMDSDEEDDEDNQEDSLDEDELEAPLDAEENMFTLNYNKSSRNRYNDFASDALFHDDFNVYDYNSAGEDDAESLPDLPASGARRRDLNQFVQDMDLSDEELEATLIAQWKADKASKKSRKRDRQQQHAEGLVGKRAKRARAAHAANAGHGSLSEYHTIIKHFVSHADYVGVEQLPLPAMDRSIRRAVHIIAQHGYNLQTKSQGSGKRRYPVLYKTKHSSSAKNLPDAVFIEEVMVQAQKTIGYTSSTKRRDPMQIKTKGKGKIPGGGGISRAAGAGAGKLRDGDIVGVDAPEIALSNRGRAMLEKLGWSHGTGLGVVGNIGISIPLTATVKNTRVGLGT